MWRWTRRILAGIVGLFVTGALVGALYQAWATARDLSQYAPPGRLVNVGGYRLHIWCTGSGNPTVILDSGLGGTTLDWSHVQSPVAEFTKVCSYDRAGMGFSDPGPRPRTSRQIARELAMLLDKGDVRGGVILVGASIGGWNMRLFASSYPERAAGLVLVDARHEDLGEQLARAGVPENPPSVAYVAPVVAHLCIARLVGIAPGQPRQRIAERRRERRASENRKAEADDPRGGSFRRT